MEEVSNEFENIYWFDKKTGNFKSYLWANPNFRFETAASELRQSIQQPIDMENEKSLI